MKNILKTVAQRDVTNIKQVITNNASFLKKHIGEDVPANAITGASTLEGAMVMVVLDWCANSDYYKSLVQGILDRS